MVLTKCSVFPEMGSGHVPLSCGLQVVLTSTVFLKNGSSHFTWIIIPLNYFLSRFHQGFAKKHTQVIV